MIIPTGSGDGVPVDLARGCLPFRFAPSCFAPESCVAVPPMVHFVWIGSALPAKYRATIAQIAEDNPSHSCVTWSAPPFELQNQDLYDAETNLGAKADILRYELVHRYGGIYLDVDHISHGPGSLHSDMCRPFVQVSGEPWCNTTNSDFGFAAGSEFLRYVIYNLRDPRVRAQREIPARTGPTFFTTCVVSFGDPRIVHPNGRALLRLLEHTGDHNWWEPPCA